MKYLPWRPDQALIRYVSAGTGTVTRGSCPQIAGWRRQALSRSGMLRPVISVVVMMLIAGCHSALFQTAKVRQGAHATVGVTRVEGAETEDVSDYSIFIKGEVGNEAHRHRFGYSAGLTIISPFKNKYRSLFRDTDIDTGTFPDEWAGVYPEFKLQAPRVLPVDVALGARFMAMAPERISLIVSRDLTHWLTLYGGCSYVATIEGIVSFGTEIQLHEDFSLLAEYSGWLSDHDYPNDFSGPVAVRPSSVGIAISYRLPRTPEPHDPRTALHW
jgi:hypothetical protein